MAKLYCYFRPTGSGPSAPSAGGYLMNFGHFLIEVEKDGRRTAFDYWLDGSRSVVKTTVDESRRRNHLYLSFFVPDAVADRMVGRIRAWAANPPEYDFPSASTCVSRSNELLRMAGLDVAGAITPDGMWSGLVAKTLGVGPGGTWVAPVGRDRGDERLTFPVEYRPQRHGVPLPPPSEVAWWAGQARAAQVGQPARLTEQARRQRALLEDLQRRGGRRTPAIGPDAARDAARRQQERQAELAREAARRQEDQRREDARRQQERQAEEQREAQHRAQARQVAAAARQSIVNEIRSRFRPTPHRVPLLPQRYTITGGPPTGPGVTGPLTQPTWATGVVWHR